MSDMTFSHAALESYVKKLSLKPGDCLLVTKLEILQQLQTIPAFGFHVPVLVSLDGTGLEKVTREQLLEILERVDQAEAAAIPAGKDMV